MVLLPKTSFEVALPCIVTAAVEFPTLIAEALDVPIFTTPVVEEAVPASTVTLPEVPALALPLVRLTAELDPASADLKAPPPIMVPLAVTVVAPATAPVLVMPPFWLSRPPVNFKLPVMEFWAALVTLNVPFDRVRLPAETVTFEDTPRVPVTDELPVTAIPPA